MFQVRRLLLLATMVLTALTLSAGTASAQLEVLEEGGEHCSPVSIVGHTVSGGCHVEYRSESHFPLVVYTPSPVVVGRCNWHFEAQIGEDGAGYVTEAIFSNEDPPGDPSCTRAPCDEDGPEGDSAMIPWPLTVAEDPAGGESFEMELCARTVSAGEGGAQIRCELHLPFSQRVGTHDHEIGRANSEFFCEAAPVFSVRNVHLINEVPAAESTEDIDLVRNPGMEVVEEDGGHCPPVSVVAHDVTGGCHVEYRSEAHVPMVAYIPSPVVFMACRWHFAARIGEDGAGYVTAASFSDEAPPGNPPCTRAPCDEDGPTGASAMVPWPLHIEEENVSQESLEMEFCMRTIASGEDGAQTRCQLHLPVNQQLGSHDHEIGAVNSEYFCEVASFPTSLRNMHFINEAPGAQSTEDIELIH
jgi:hypothetical protein